MRHPRSDELSGDHDARNTRVAAPPSGGTECATNAREMGLDRKTVGRYLEQAAAVSGVTAEAAVTDEIAAVFKGSCEAGPRSAGARRGAVTCSLAPLGRTEEGR